MMNSTDEEPFDFEKYRIREEPKDIKDSQQQENEPMQDEEGSSIEEPFDFSKYQLNKSSEKSTILESLDPYVRLGARVISRIGETVLGFPGDTIKLVEWIGSKFPNIPEFLKKEPNYLQRTVKKIAESLPTSQELREKSSELSKGFTDPQNAMEEFGDSVVELASVLTFGKDPRKIKNLIQSIGKSISAKGVSKGIESLGGGEGLQLAGEIGTLFITGMFDEKLADKFVSDKYKKSYSLIPDGTMIDTSNFLIKLNDLESDLSKGLSTASKNEVKSAVSELKSKVSGGAFSARELVDSYHDINERLSSKKLFNELNKTERKKLKFRYDKLKDEVSSEIRKYGESNPKFYKEWQQANQAFATIQDSKTVTNYLESIVGKLPPKLATGVAVELMLGHPIGAVTIIGAAGTLKTGELLYRVANSPSLREHYLNVLKYASAENLPALINELNKLDSGLKKELISNEYIFKH